MHGLSQRHHLLSLLPHVALLLLGGSWVVISRVISRVTILLTHIRGLTTPPPSCCLSRAHNSASVAPLDEVSLLAFFPVLSCRI